MTTSWKMIFAYLFKSKNHQKKSSKKIIRINIISLILSQTNPPLTII
jgi:hypothetical protein